MDMEGEYRRGAFSRGIGQARYLRCDHNAVSCLEKSDFTAYIGVSCASSQDCFSLRTAQKQTCEIGETFILVHDL